MTNNKKNNKSDKPARPAKRIRRLLVRIGFVIAILIGLFIALRLLYPLWINMSLPEDAPRIAFSLDNTLYARIGVTDLTYQRVMAAAGGRLITIRPDAAGDPVVDMQAVEDLLDKEKIDGVLLTGGGDVDPELYGGDPNATMLVHRLRDDFEIALIRAARQRGLPILGVCRGCQIINIALGGTVRNLRNEPEIKDLHLVLGGHEVNLEPNSKLAETLGVTHLSKVVSLHGNAVAEPAPGVRVAAYGPGDVIEAIETDSAGREGWIVGIQWHPELTLDEQVQQKVYQELVSRARKVRDQRLAAENQNAP